MTPTSLRRRARQTFLAAFPGPPWRCAHCGGEITQRGRFSQCLNVHHLDENIENFDLSNLQPAHRGCHQSTHLHAWFTAGKGWGSSQAYEAKCARAATPEGKAQLSRAGKIGGATSGPTKTAGAYKGWATRRAKKNA